MTTEEVVDVFKETRKEINFKSELLDKAIEALEKQIPKEPKIEQIKYGSIAKCPTCDKLCYGFDYCIGCGQRMNWSDNNE